MPRFPAMVSGQKAASFTITDAHAPRRATDKDIAAVAMELWTSVCNQTPVRTGTLLRGWEVRKVRDGVYRVYNDVYYVKFVEFGTEHEAARPAMGKSLMVVRRKYQRGRGR